MHIAVTGGTGYVGAHTVRALLAAGHTVRLLVVPGGNDDAALDALCQLGPLEVLAGDIRNPATVSELLAECDAVLAAAQESGRKAAVNHELRVSRQWRQVRDHRRQ